MNKKKHKICIIIGTRPEIIKLYKIVKILKNKKNIDCVVLYTNQHKEIGAELFKIFRLQYDHKIKRSQHKKISFEYVDKIYDFLKKQNINSVVVMGDTLTGVTGSIAAFLNKSKIFYVESGLRTGDFNHPWPEEGFRKMMSTITNIHFAPTNYNKNILIKEGVDKKNIYVTGNPVIDAVKDGIAFIKKKKVREKLDKKIKTELNFIPKNFILITIHRRENFGEPFNKICTIINKLSIKYKNLKFIYPVHPNPYIKKTAKKFFRKNKNVHIIKPLDYLTFLRMMQLSKFIISDSGGIQEECTILNKYVLLARKKTERPEIKDKLVFICGSNYSKFKKYFKIFLKSRPKKNLTNTFGDGKASHKISKLILSKSQ